MKITVTHEIKDTGEVVMTVESETRQECYVSFRPNEADTHVWAIGSIATTVAGLLHNAMPKKEQK